MVCRCKRLSLVEQLKKLWTVTCYFMGGNYDASLSSAVMEQVLLQTHLGQLEDGVYMIHETLLQKEKKVLSSE